MAGLPVPVPRTWTPADIVTGALLNTNVRDTANFLLNPPLFVGGQATASTASNATWTPVGQDTSYADNYAGHSTTTNTSLYTAPVSGWFLCVGAVGWVANTAGDRQVGFGVNSLAGPLFRSVVSGPACSSGSVATVQRAATRIYLSAGQYVALLGWQGSGAALSTSPPFCEMSVKWESN